MSNIEDVRLSAISARNGVAYLTCSYKKDGVNKTVKGISKDGVVTWEKGGDE